MCTIIAEQILLYKYCYIQCNAMCSFLMSKIVLKIILNALFEFKTKKTNMTQRCLTH